MLAVEANVMTEFVKANGMGRVDPLRFEEAISQLAETYDYQEKPNADLYFTNKYLPTNGFSLN